MTKLEELQAASEVAEAALAAAKADLNAAHRAARSADWEGDVAWDAMVAWAAHDAAIDDYYAAKAALDAELDKEKTDG